MQTLRTAFLFCFVTAVSLPAPAVAGEWTTQKNVHNGVTITVTPQALPRDAGTWAFKVALDTHTQDLADELVKTAVLVDDAGARHTPMAWEGPAPGGHHRSGVLRFNRIVPLPRTIELQIRRPNEPVPRSFKWALR